MSQMPQAMKVQKLEYATSLRRPRMFAVVGMISIGVAIFGILIGGVKIFYYPRISAQWTSTVADRELSVLSTQYTKAQIETIEARAQYMARNPILIKAQQHEAQLSKAYQAKLAEVLRTRAIVIDRLVIASLLNALFSFFLLASGIVILVNARRGRRMHLLYAMIKIPLAILTTVLWFVTLVKFGNSSRNSDSFWACFQVVIMCIYPVSLLLILRRYRVMEYINGLSAEQASLPPDVDNG
jgi:hypothetical protein